MAFQFDHEKLDVYRASIEFVAWADELILGLRGRHANVRDQIVRASQSIPLNIAEGVGKPPGNDRRRFFDIARGSSMECAAALDVLVVVRARTAQDVEPGKVLLWRIVCMLSKMTDRQEPS